MAHSLHVQQTSRRLLEGIGATIRALVRIVAAEHTLAQRAATKAALPRQRLAEVRAMYAPPVELHQQATVSRRAREPHRDLAHSNPRPAEVKPLIDERSGSTALTD